MPSPPKSLRVFLSHYSGDKALVLELYNRLQGDGFVPWLAQKDLIPGQNWEIEIGKAIRSSDLVIVFLSRKANERIGYLQKEIRLILDSAEEHPEENIFVIPVKLEECELPERLKKLHWVNYFEEDGYQQLVRTLKHCASIYPGKEDDDDVTPPAPPRLPPVPKTEPQQIRTSASDLMTRFLSISPIASWLFGSVLLTCLVLMFFPRAVLYSVEVTRFLSALSAGLGSVFFIGGVLSKGKLYGFLVSLTIGSLLFVVLQFYYNPFVIHHEIEQFFASTNVFQSLSPTPSPSPSPTPTVAKESKTASREVSVVPTPTPTVEPKPTIIPGSNIFSDKPLKFPKTWQFTEPPSAKDCWGNPALTIDSVLRGEARLLYRRFYDNWKSNPPLAYEAAKELAAKKEDVECIEHAKRYIDEYEKQVFK